MRLAWHRDISPAEAAYELQEAARCDPLGHRIHLVLACLWCVLCTFPTTVVEFAGIPLVLMFLARIPHMWRTWKAFGIQPAVMVFACFVAWQAISLAWSPDVKQGLHELSCNRWFWATWMLWPLVAHQRTLLRAILIGLLIGIGVQFINALAARGYLPATLHLFHRPTHRDSGWWDPVAGGSLLVAALGLWLGPSLSRAVAPYRRAIAALGACATLLAILATGTRGAWIAAAALVTLALAIEIIRPRLGATSRASRGVPKLPSVTLPPSFALPLMLMVMPLAFALTLSTLSTRIRFAQQDLTAARAGNYTTDTGARLYMWDRALDAVAAHPLKGVGAGGYKSFAQQHAPGATAAPVHAHAHSAPLHIAATLGLPGLILITAVLVLLLRGGLPDQPCGPALAILGLALAGLFDVVHINQQTAALLFTLMPFCFISRPATPER